MNTAKKKQTEAIEHLILYSKLIAQLLVVYKFSKSERFHQTTLIIYDETYSEAQNHNVWLKNIT